MNTIILDAVDEATMARNGAPARHHGRSIADEVRAIVTAAIPPDRNPFSAIREIVDPHGGFEIDLPDCERIREPHRVGH